MTNTETTAKIYTDIDGITYGPLAVTQSETVHRTGLIEIDMADGSNPTVEQYLTPRKTWTVELFPRTVGYWRLIVA